MHAQTTFKTGYRYLQQDQATKPDLELIDNVQLVLLHSRKLLLGVAVLLLLSSKLLPHCIMASQMLIVTPDVCHLPQSTRAQLSL